MRPSDRELKDYLLNTIVTLSQLPSVRWERQAFSHTTWNPVRARNSSHRAGRSHSAGDDSDLDQSGRACRHLHEQAAY